ncbi:putative phage abortive infection protein [Pedobacter sp.]|uniref:putative phage abortive infection protein n=1 Tax=Pedobacter sp. TaxID=1411316 RepID=UPI0031D2E538
MMKIIIKALVYLFIFIGLLLLVSFILKVWSDGKIVPFGKIDLVYTKLLGESAQVLAITWSIIGVLLIIMTLNIQKDQFLDNQKFIEKQQFETTFFNMLNVLHNIKLSMKKKVVTGAVVELYEGQNFIDYALGELADEYGKSYNLIDPDSSLGTIFTKIGLNEKIESLEQEIIRDDFNIAYMSFYKNFHSELGHYFRYLYNLLQFTLKNRKPANDHLSYINLVQAQLSNNELALIFYNVLSDKGLNRGKTLYFYNLLDEYNFFENIDENSLIKRAHHVLYPKTRFKFLNIDEIKTYHS